MTNLYAASKPFPSLHFSRGFCFPQMPSLQRLPPAILIYIRAHPSNSFLQPWSSVGKKTELYFLRSSTGSLWQLNGKIQASFNITCNNSCCFCYGTKLGSPHLSSKASLLTLGCGEGNCNVYCSAPSKEFRAESPQRGWILWWVSAKHF